MKIVLVHGPPRSGTTLVARAIGASTGLAFVGEVERAWEWRDHQRHCGCGLTMQECEAWAGAPLGRTAYKWLQRRASPQDLVRPLMGATPSAAAGAYSHDLGSLYRHLARSLDAAGLVDSSKYVRSLVASCLVEDIDLVVVHLVRDPRGALHSRVRLRQQRARQGVHAQPTLARHGLLLACADAAMWLARTWVSPLIARRAGVRQVYLRYESFCQDPQAGVALVASALNMEAAPVVGPQATIELPMAHSAGGNAGRFASGPVAVSEDTSWRSESRGGERLVASATSVLFTVVAGMAERLGRIGRTLGERASTVKP